jgi:aryl-alcohol dehydrogenase
LSRESLAWVQRTAGAAPVRESLALAEPRDDEIVVRLVATGICHTDLLAPQFIAAPAVFGHEGAGIVEFTGRNVTKVRPGDPVAMTFGSCGVCRACCEAEPAYCADFAQIQYGGSRRDGSAILSDAAGPVRGAFFAQSSFATRALVNERSIVRLPPEFPLELAAPLGCGVQTGAGAVLNALAARAGDDLAVFGAGSVGLSAVMAARIAGCARIIAVDINPARLALALQLGATHVFDARDDDIVARIRALTGDGVRYSLETAGVEASFRAAFDCLAKRGTCGVVAVPNLGKPFPFAAGGLLHGRRLVGIIEGSSVPDVFIPQLVRHHLAGRLPFDRMVSWYEFDALPKALADAAAGSVVKAIVRMPPAQA